MPIGLARALAMRTDQAARPGNGRPPAAASCGLGRARISNRVSALLDMRSAAPVKPGAKRSPGVPLFCAASTRRREAVRS